MPAIERAIRIDAHEVRKTQIRRTSRGMTLRSEIDDLPCELMPISAAPNDVANLEAVKLAESTRHSHSARVVRRHGPRTCGL